jgi:ribonuclease P protein component
VPLTSTVDIISRPMRSERITVETILGTRPNSAMPPIRARFPRTARLLRHADFERVYKQGRRHFSASMTVFYLARPAVSIEARSGAAVPHGLRIGFTVGRALGGAVQRNRMKRRLREAVRMSRSVAEVAADIVINPKKSLLNAEFADILNEVSRAFVIIEQKLAPKRLEKSAPDSTANIKAGSGKPPRLRSGQAPPEGRT